VKLIRLLRGHIPQVIAVLALLVVQAICDSSLPRYMSDIVDTGIVGEHAGDFSYLSQTALVMFGFCLASLIASAAADFLAAQIAAKVSRDLRHDVFSKVMLFSSAQVDHFSQSSLITRCTNDIQQIQNLIVVMLRVVVFAPIMGIVALAQVISIGGGLTWIIGVALLVILGVVSLLFTLTKPRFKKMQALVDRVNLVAREMLNGIMTIRAFNRQHQELDRFDDASRDLMSTQLFVNRAMSLMMPIMMLVMNVATVAIVWFGGSEVAAGSMQVGSVMAFISYAMMIVASFLILSMVAIILPRAEVSVGRVEEVLATVPEIASPKECLSPAQTTTKGELAFEHVSFHYPAAKGNVIEDVSFSVRPGELTAIVGPTGSGKSTLLQLIPRLYDPTSGKITLDGIELDKMSLADVRSRIGYVPQQAFLFSGTIDSNVAFGSTKVSRQEVLEAINVAQAHEIVEQRKGGLDAEISQGGANVSGGQRQRLAIARALAIEPEVLVLDDSFSALDYTTDAHLRQALSRNRSKIAILVVAQRIATVMDASQIIVLDEGRVVGKGTHSELLSSCPEYLEMAKSQLSESELGLDEVK